MNFFKHPQALVESNNVGRGTRVWAFAHVLPGAVIGEDCNLCDHTFIENDVRIGDRVTIKCGVQLWDGVTLEDDVFVGPNVTFTNDPFPRSKQRPAEYARTVVRQGASIGGNATILPGLTIGAHAMVGAGAVVTRSVPPYAIVVGNPARIVGYTTQGSPAPEARPVPSPSREGTEILVPGVSLRKMPVVDDLRGSLSFGEFDRHLPFVPKRYFIVFDVPGKEVRGEHAHRQLHQFLVCVKGSCAVVVDDGQRRQELLLDSPGLGIHIPPMVWATQYKYTSDAVLMVLASDVYDPKDYIRDYDEFLAEKRTKS
jgi:acetyltransferase-like isoleucine patch superfamily enzyme/dTDP-4-dehydrorhamnose 3,5-epimerase-like enzyme